MSVTPRFRHDCPTCHLFATNEKGDWYTCDGRPWRSLIFRYGEEDSEYASTALFESARTSPTLVAGLLAGLRLTEDEVRAMLAGFVAHEATASMPKLARIDAYGAITIPDISHALRAAITEKP